MSGENEEKFKPFEHVDRRTAMDIIKGDLGDSINPPSNLNKSVGDDATKSKTPTSSKGKQNQKPKNISEGGQAGKGISAKGIKSQQESDESMTSDPNATKTPDGDVGAQGQKNKKPVSSDQVSKGIGKPGQERQTLTNKETGTTADDDRAEAEQENEDGGQTGHHDAGEDDYDYFCPIHNQFVKGDICPGPKPHKLDERYAIHRDKKGKGEEIPAEETERSVAGGIRGEKGDLEKSEGDQSEADGGSNKQYDVDHRVVELKNQRHTPVKNISESDLVSKNMKARMDAIKAELRAPNYVQSQNPGKISANSNVQKAHTTAGEKAVIPADKSKTTQKGGNASLSANQGEGIGKKGQHDLSKGMSTDEAVQVLDYNSKKRKEAEKVLREKAEAVRKQFAGVFKELYTKVDELKKEIDLEHLSYIYKNLGELKSSINSIVDRMRWGNLKSGEMLEKAVNILDIFITDFEKSYAKGTAVDTKEQEDDGAGEPGATEEKDGDEQDTEDKKKKPIKKKKK